MSWVPIGQAKEQTRRHGGGLPIMKNQRCYLIMNGSLIEEELTKNIIGAAIEVHRYCPREKGAKTVPGLGMLVYQSAGALKLFTGVDRWLRK